MKDSLCAGFSLAKLIVLERKASLADTSGLYLDLFGVAPTIAGVTVTAYTAMGCTGREDYW